MRASSYLPLPKELKAKQGCFNIQNNDDKCFLWSILASLHSLQYRNNLNTVLKYQEYEQNNIIVNFYGYEDKKIFPLRVTTMTVAKHHVNLLYITADEISHYVLVNDLSRLVISQYINTTTKNISVNIVCMAVPVKRY